MIYVSGLTPLMLAVIEKKPSHVELLLKNGANANIRDTKSGRTALFHAVENDSSDIINLLLRYKADPRLNNFLGMNAIDAAKDSQCSEKYAMLLENQENWSACKRRKHDVADKTDTKCKMTIISSLQKIEESINKPKGAKNAKNSGKKNKK